MIAIYARVSTGMQATEGHSLNQQVELCENKAKELYPNKQINTYKEEGVSGEDIDRPKINQLRQDVLNGLISHIICTHPDRLSRDLTDKLIVCKEFEKYEVELIFVDTEYKNTPEGQLFFNMQSAIAQYELALIKKRTTRGRLKAVEKNNQVMPMRVSPFGYDYVEGSLIINEEESQFVKLIYEWYINEKLTMRGIGERLYKLGVIPKRGESKNWNASSIRRILTSEIYIGKYYYNRKKTQKIKGEKTQNGNPKKTYEIRDKSEWIELIIPSIIDLPLWNLAQEQKVKNIKQNNGNTKHEYLLQSLLRCGHCGRMWHSTSYPGRVKNGVRPTYPAYRCRQTIPRKYGEGVEKCIVPITSIRANILDDYVWDEIINIILNPKTFIQDAQKNSSNIIESIQGTINMLTNQAEKKEKEKEKIKTMFRRDVITEEEMYKDISKLNKEILDINTDILKFQQQIEHQIKIDSEHEKLETIFISTQTKIQNDQLTFEEKRNIVKSLIDEIIININEGNVSLTYIGELELLKNNIIDIDTCLQPQENVNKNQYKVILSGQANFRLNKSKIINGQNNYSFDVK